MRHRALSRKLGRNSAHRKAMLRNMVTSLLRHERIQTTDAKAKEVRRLAERMITLGKRGGLHARRRALRVIRSREVAAKVFDELADRYRERAGGYTRVLKLGIRHGDAAPLSLVELVGGEAGAAAAAGKKAAAGRSARKAAAAKRGAAAEPAAPKKAASAKAAAGGKKTGRKAASKKAAAKPAAKKGAAKKSAGKKKTRKKTES
jgi:large subunit ribosomal protein L17